MTCIEKYMETCTEDPKVIVRDFCPHWPPHRYLPQPDECINANGVTIDYCERCWNREIPEETKTIVAHMPPFDTVEDSVSESTNFENKRAINISRDEITELHEIVKKAMEPQILDSGNRRKFETGAVRDIQEGKGRCDLMPLDVVAGVLCSYSAVDTILHDIYLFQMTGDASNLYYALDCFIGAGNRFTMILEVSKHFEEGAKKYGEHNWQKGIPTNCYIDSAVRHYLKFLRGDTDEPHDRAFVWNLMCCIWTCKHKPELNVYRKEEPVDG